MIRAVMAAILGLATMCVTGADSAQAVTRQDTLPSVARSHGFFPGLSDDVIAGQGHAVCFFLQTGSVADLVSYEMRIGLSPATGMRGPGDLVEFAAESVAAYCP